MKKIFLITAMISVLILAGCGKKEPTSPNVPERTPQEQEIVSNVQKTDNSEEQALREKMKKAEDFLAPMVGYEQYPYNIFEEVTIRSNDEGATLNRIVKMLFAGNHYEKDGEKYCFRLEDLKDYAKKFFNQDDFYGNDNYEYNPDTNQYESTLQFGLFDESFLSYEKPTVKSIHEEDGKTIVNVSVVSHEQNKGTLETAYMVTLEENEDSFVIEKIKWFAKLVI